MWANIMKKSVGVVLNLLRVIPKDDITAGKCIE